MSTILGVDPAETNTGLALISTESGIAEVLMTRRIPEYRPGRFFETIGELSRIEGIDLAVIEEPPVGKGRMSSGSLRTLFVTYGAIREAIAMCGIRIVEVPVAHWRGTMLPKPPLTPILKKKKDGDWIKRHYWTKGKRTKELTIPDNLSPAVMVAVSRYCHPEMSVDEMEAILIAVYGIKFL